MCIVFVLELQAHTLQATRVLEPMESSPPGVLDEQVIWQTTEQAFSYQGDPNIEAINNVVLNVNKPGPAKYLGFGEQGGRTVLKNPTYMNFFCKILISTGGRH